MVKHYKLKDNSKIIVICNDSTKYLAKHQIEEVLDEIEYVIVSEPVNRNTTAAIAISLELTNPNDNIVVLPSDQIWDNNEFTICISKLIEAKHDGISFIGIKSIGNCLVTHNQLSPSTNQIASCLCFLRGHKYHVAASILMLL